MKRWKNQPMGLLACWLAIAATVLAWAPGVKAEPDLSSPKSAALSFAVALEKGDTEAAKAAAVLTPQNSEMISVLSEMGQNVNKLREAAKAKFGDAAAEQFGEPRHSPEEVAKQLDQSEVKVDADTATITSAPSPDGRRPKGSLTLKKVNNDWRVDLSSGPMAGQLQQQIPMLHTFANTFNEVAGEISTDKYKTADEAKQAIQARIMAAMAQASRPASSQPATTQPAATPG